MYNLEINFLKDRGLSSDASMALPDHVLRTQGGAIPGQEPEPLWIGAGIGALGLLVGGLLLLQANRAKANIQRELVEVNQQLDLANAQEARKAAIQREIDAYEDQSKAFVDILQTQVKPWAAVLEEISDLTPSGLKISSYEQNGNDMLVTGTARSFTEVNDLVLNLPESPLVEEESVYVVRAELVDNPITLEQINFPRPVESFVMPQVVEYTISLTLSNLSDAEVIQTLESQGAIGMAERLRSSF